MPWYGLVLLLGAPTVLAAGWTFTRIARVLGYPRERRPGYLDLRRKT